MVYSVVCACVWFVWIILTSSATVIRWRKAKDQGPVWVDVLAVTVGGCVVTGFMVFVWYAGQRFALEV